MARPSKYSVELSEKICEEIASSSKSMKTICEELDIPVRTVLNWIATEEEFLQKYTRAKEQQADFLAEEIIEIADDARNDFMTIQLGNNSYEQENKEVTGRSKLRVEARKWVAAKLKPKKYGDKLDLSSGGEELKFNITLNLTS